MKYEKLQQERFLSFCNMLEKLYTKALADRKEELLRIMGTTPLPRLTTFELMEHDFRENTHSNVLQYLFDPRLFEKARDLLKKFITEALGKEKAMMICPMIHTEDYQIEREYPVDEGRLDLLIHHRNELGIIIENKLMATVAKKGAERTQLHVYRDFVKDKYRHHALILLSLDDNAEEAEQGGFSPIRYSTLYEILRSIDSKDTVFTEYRTLLHFLVHGIHDRASLLEELLNFRIDQTAIPSLTSLDNIRRMLYESTENRN